MSKAAFVSRLRAVVQERRLDVAELQRRLERRGYPVDRRTLERLLSDRPIQEVQLGILIPLLDELGLDLPAAFAPCGPAADLPPPSGVPSQLREGPTRRDAIAAADAELVEVSARLEADLRKRAPDLFDSQGCLIPAAFDQWLLDRAGRTVIGKQDVFARAKQR